MLRLVLDITTEIIATKNQENDSSNTKMVQCHEINQNQFVSENTSQKSGMQWNLRTSSKQKLESTPTLNEITKSKTSRSEQVILESCDRNSNHQLFTTPNDQAMKESKSWNQNFPKNEMEKFKLTGGVSSETFSQKSEMEPIIVDSWSEISDTERELEENENCLKGSYQARPRMSSNQHDLSHKNNYPWASNIGINLALEPQVNLKTDEDKLRRTRTNLWNMSTNPYFNFSRYSNHLGAFDLSIHRDSLRKEVTPNEDLKQSKPDKNTESASPSEPNNQNLTDTNWEQHSNKDLKNAVLLI